MQQIKSIAIYETDGATSQTGSDYMGVTHQSFSAYRTDDS